MHSMYKMMIEMLSRHAYGATSKERAEVGLKTVREED